MPILTTLALALQVTVSASAPEGAVSVSVGVGLPRTRTVAVTEAMRRTAFRDTVARDLLQRARAARSAQDSSLRGYDARSYQRVSAGMTLRETARERLVYRSEGAARVRWRRGVGARVEVLGARAALPILSGIDQAQREADDEMDLTDLMAIPYYPGMDELWLFNMIGGRDEEEDTDGTFLVHPVAEGSEAFFTFAAGDSMTVALPGGRQIQLRELRVTPREARWNTVSASLWFELEGAHLVRAALRFSDRMDIWAVAQADDSTAMDDVPMVAKALITPMEADLTAMTIEYGLYEGRFWLPRTQAAEFRARVSFMRLPMTVEQRFRYDAVNGTDPIPAMPPAPPSLRTLRDSLRAAGLDSAAVRAAMRTAYAKADTTAAALRARQCAEGRTEVRRGTRYQGVRMDIAVEIPCDRSTLATSLELPPSLFTSGEALFGAAEREALVSLLADVLPPDFVPRPPTLAYGLAQTRYNRVEGLSTAVEAQAVLGRGLRADAALRGSLGDQRIAWELGLARRGVRTTWRLGGYRRVAVSSDFGAPLSFGAGVAALLYGRDEGFYHRATGVEVTRTLGTGQGLDVRLFTEHQRSTDVATRFSLFSGADDPRMGVNVIAEPGTFSGAAVRWRESAGLDPRGWRVVADVRLEGATGRTATFPPPWCDACRFMLVPAPRDRSYGRVVGEATVSRGLGPVAAALTLAAGTTAGRVPTQRLFFLGGLQSVRGASAGAMSGDGMWMARQELGLNRAGVRPVVFADVGWAGPRAEWRTPAALLRGAGVGVSFLDGMFRADLSRGGLGGVRQTRFDVSVEARF
jgi:Haemolysin secretion/activation protein ShlB/FhaC/HecB